MFCLRKPSSLRRIRYEQVSTPWKSTFKCGNAEGCEDSPGFAPDLRSGRRGAKLRFTNGGCVKDWLLNLIPSLT